MRFLYPVFLGSKWQDDQTWAALAGDLQLFMRDIFQSSYVSTLDQYGFLAGTSPGAHFEGAFSGILDDAGVAQLVADLKNQALSRSMASRAARVSSCMPRSSSSMTR